MRSRQEESKLSSRVGSSTNLNGIAQDQTFNKSKSGTQSPRNENVKYVGFVTANIYQAAILNKFLQREGFKIDLVANVERNTEHRLDQLRLQKKNKMLNPKLKKAST